MEKTRKEMILWCDVAEIDLKIDNWLGYGWTVKFMETKVVPILSGAMSFVVVVLMRPEEEENGSKESGTSTAREAASAGFDLHGKKPW